MIVGKQSILFEENVYIHGIFDCIRAHFMQFDFFTAYLEHISAIIFQRPLNSARSSFIIKAASVSK